MYFDIDALLSEAAGSAASDGKKIYYENARGLIVREDNGGKTRFVSRGGKTTITFDENGGLYEYTCTCGYPDEMLSPCQHIVAAALQLSEAEEFCPHNATMLKKTDAAASAVIKDYTRRRNTRYSDGGDKVELEPIFCITSKNEPYLRFKIGRTRKYTVKSVSEFLLAIASKSTVRYGAGLKFRHLERSFTQGSARLVEFLLACRKDRISLGVAAGLAKDELALSLSEVDEFFSLYTSKRIVFSHSNSMQGQRQVECSGKLRPKICIKKEDEGYRISFKGEDFFLLEGRKFCYFIDKDCVHRCDISLMSSAGSLLSSIKKNGSLFVAEPDMAVFYNNVLSEAGETLEIEAGDIDLVSFEAPPLHAEIYLSAKDEGVIEAELKCRYGDVQTDIMAADVLGTYRDWESESKLKSTLARYFPHYPRLELQEDGDVYNLFKEGLEALYNYSEIFVAESLSGVKIRKAPRISAGLRLTTGLLEMDFSDIDYTEEELAKITQAYQRENRFVRLNDGSFIDLGDETVGALSSLLILGEMHGKTLAMPAFYAPLVEEKVQEGLLIATVDGGYERLIGEIEGYKNQQIDFGSLSQTLRNYQKDGVKWLRMLQKNNLGGILADDMGLGKTLQILALIKARSSGGACIVVCPTSLIINWAMEARKFTPTLRTLAVMGSGKEREELIAGIADYDLVITSYELLKRDLHLYEGIQFDIAVLDEAQYIKNHETKNARAVKKLTAQHRFALTGTPIENSLAELWSIFDFLMPGYLLSYSKFRAEYEAGIIRGNSTVAQDLKKAVSPFILRRLKSSVLKELPPKTETEITIPLIGEQKEIYQQHLALIKQTLDGGEKKDRITILSMLMRLRQICCDPVLANESYKGNSEKLETCLNLLRTATASSHKTLLFSQFTSVLKIIGKKLKDEGISYYVLEGSTPKQERSRLIESFNKDDVSVFLISLRAGGTGINLTGADTVIHYDPWWNDPVMNQATDRAYRLGQKNNVNVYKLIIKDSIEEKITTLRQKKSALADMFLETNPTMPLEDLMTLIL